MALGSFQKAVTFSISQPISIIRSVSIPWRNDPDVNIDWHLEGVSVISERKTRWVCRCDSRT
jgi:hypothetical protein